MAINLGTRLTEPLPRFPEGVKPNPTTLAAGRYGTQDMVDIWGPERTFEYSLRAQGVAAVVLSRLHPGIIPPYCAEEIAQKASLEYISADRIRELEEQTGHDVIAINKALEEVVSEVAKPHVNKARTSADTTQTARALQMHDSLRVICASLENLRDIMLEKAFSWADVPYMDTTHQYDAMPTTAGRPLTHYAEMLQSDMDLLGHLYTFSIFGKWGDATGNHHSATSLGINGMELEEAYCRELNIRHMTASAQISGLEFEADITYLQARIGATLNNIARYIATGRGDDTNIFVNASPKKRKGSSAMPHKDAKNGNPTAEEQTTSLYNYLAGNLVTGMMNTEFPYARNLAASANSRINSEDSFKFMDHVIRNLAGVIYWLGLNEERSIERVNRSYGVVMSPEVQAYITSPRWVDNPLPRSEAHDLLGELAQRAYDSKTPFVDVLLGEDRITSRLDDHLIRRIGEPTAFIGQSREIILLVHDRLYQKRIFIE